MSFAVKSSTEDSGKGFIAKVNRRRFAALKEAGAIVEVLPGEGESLHAIMTGFYDLMHVLIAMIDRLGSKCLEMRIATLSMSARNVQELVSLIDLGKVASISILVSHFFSKHDPDIFKSLLTEFGSRNQLVGVARSHAKMVTMSMEDGGQWTIEGSANLRTNRNLEQVTVSRDARLHDWAAQWISEMVTKNEQREGGQADAEKTG